MRDAKAEVISLTQAIQVIQNDRAKLEAESKRLREALDSNNVWLESMLAVRAIRLPYVNGATARMELNRAALEMRVERICRRDQERFKRRTPTGDGGTDG